MRNLKEDKQEIEKGQECGLVFDFECQVGDVIECFETSTVSRSLDDLAARGANTSIATTLENVQQSSVNLGKNKQQLQDLLMTETSSESSSDNSTSQPEQL
jgi:hypothetical protein